jgi:hypothetical protein
MSEVRFPRGHLFHLDTGSRLYFIEVCTLFTSLLPCIHTLVHILYTIITFMLVTCRQPPGPKYAEASFILFYACSIPVLPFPDTIIVAFFKRTYLRSFSSHSHPVILPFTRIWSRRPSVLYQNVSCSNIKQPHVLNQ